MPDALILSHGSPSDPGPQEAAMQALARGVAALYPHGRVLGATLAAPGALESALAALDRPLVYPFFMAEGWFTTTFLPRRLAQAGAPDLPRLPAFGSAPELAALCTRIVTQAAQAAGFATADTQVLLAAHGSGGDSPVSRISAQSTRAMATTIRILGGFARVRPGFVEEPPFLHDAATGMGTAAVCLPFFALRASHVEGDLPEALEKAAYQGLLLPPVGAHDDVPAIIAAALSRAGQGWPEAPGFMAQTV